MIDPSPPEIATDLVEYLVLVVPGPDALAAVGPELVRVVDSAAIRILDLVVVRLDENGTLSTIEIDTLGGLEAVQAVTACYGALLSRHDLELVSLALQPGDCAIVLVAEDRWAEPLAVAARGLGGEVRAGERIARERVEAALVRRTRRPEEGGTMTATAISRDDVPDLLTRPPSGTREFVSEWAHLLVDPVQQLALLADLFEVGLLSWTEYERYKGHIRLH